MCSWLGNSIMGKAYQRTKQTPWMCSKCLNTLYVLPRDFSSPQQIAMRINLTNFQKLVSPLNNDQTCWTCSFYGKHYIMYKTIGLADDISLYFPSP